MHDGQLVPPGSVAVVGSGDDVTNVCADVLLKVSSQPHLLQLDLFESVDSTATSASLADQELKFTLKKVLASRRIRGEKLLSDALQ